MEDEERKKKLIRGRALFAQYQLKKARAEAQNSSKKQKRKKKPSAKKCEESSHTSNIDQSQSDELYMTSSQRGAPVTPDITRTLHTGEIIKHDQSYTIEMESEISTTTDDYTSEEEEFGVSESYSEQGAQFPSKRLEMMENELAGKQQEIEELNRELEEMRAAYGTEGFQQLQEFEAAIKQRDGIITQLTATLQQARREKDETMREFLEVTEQSQKLQIQFHHLQASQSLRNTNHSSTAADLLQAKQQIVRQQQQLEGQDHLLEDYQKKTEEFKMQINFLQEKIGTYEMEMKEQTKKVEDSRKKELEEKDSVIEELKIKLVEEEENSIELKDRLIATDKLLGEFKEQITEKDQEINNIRLELANSEQKERQCSDEIKQLLGTVEELQKKTHKESQFETEMVQRMEIETQQKLEKLRVELDEMYGQQIVQMKQELIKQHMFELDELHAQHKGELENVLKTCPNIPANENQIQLMNMAITELKLKLQDANSQKKKISEELEIISRAKSVLQSQLEDLFEELNFSREQVQRARQTIVEQEDELNEARKLLSSVEDLKAQIVSASEFRKELELKHEAEVTNYKIKLEMLEKEKNAVLDRMAESQEAELERLRTQLLFSHEEELTRLREDLEIEHEISIQKLKDNLSVHYKQQIEELQNEMRSKIESIQFEKDNLITKQNQLFLEISKLKDLQQSLVNSKSEEMTLQIKELQKEIEVLRKEEKEKGTLEQEVQELQLKTEFLEKQIKEKEDNLQEKFTQLETENTILKNEKKTLEDMLKIHSPISKEEDFIFIDSVKPKSEECEWQKKMDILLEENEKLTKECTQLNEEIERQRNTYSFAEKNFEINYQELREEYAYLLKVKSDLEDSKSKQEVEYQMKLKALTDELYHLQKSKPVLLVKTKSADSESCKDDKSFTAEISEVGEVVEKDTTELMEKLEVTQREKLELSERLSDLSEQLKQKHSEINHLSEEVKSLKQEKEQVLKRCKELEIMVGQSRAEHMDELKLKPGNFKDGIQTEGSKDSVSPVLKIKKDFDEGAKIMEMNMKKESKQELVKPEKYSLLDPMDSMTFQLANDSLSSSLDIAQSENDQLRQELNPLKSEQLTNEAVMKEEMDIEVPRKQPQGSLKEEEEAKLSNEAVMKEEMDIIDISGKEPQESLEEEEEAKLTNEAVMKEEMDIEVPRKQPQGSLEEEEEAKLYTEALMKEEMDIGQVVRERQREEEMAKVSNETLMKEEMDVVQLLRKKRREEDEMAKKLMQDERENQGVEEVQLRPEKLKECRPAVSPDSITKDRNPLQEANNQLIKILLPVVKTIAAVEETAGRGVLGVLDPSYRITSPANVVWETETEGRVQYYICKEEEPLISCCGSGTPSNAPGTSSEMTDEKEELCQHLLQCKLSGAEIDLKSEELILNVSSRLQAVVEKLLEAVKGPNSQLQHAKVTQTELVCQSFRQKKKTSKFLEFQQPVSEEQKAREHLDSELGRTEHIIGGEEEEALFKSELEEKGNLIDYLEEELFCVGTKLEELEEEREQIEEERKFFSREKAIWKAEKLLAHQELVEETEKLMREKLEVQRQAEKVCGDLQKQVKTLEMDVEEQVSRFKELEQEKTTEVMDLRQQNQFLEKQLEKMRKFLDEQAFDREHERDVFQQEIQKLEQKLKATPKFQPVSEHQTREVEQLTNHLNEKTDKCSELLLSKEQLQRDVQERNKEIEKLESRIRELEQALLTSANNLQKVENRKHLGTVEAKELPFEVQLQAEREALDRKEKEITNLEEQLEQFREELENKNEELQQLHMQLEIEKKERTAHLEDLEQEKRFLQDEMERLGFAVQEFEDISTKDHHQVFGKFTQMIQEKKLEIGRQNDHITDLQKQLEVTADKKVIQEKDEEIHYLESQLECLKSNQERIKKNSKEEIEQLNDVIEKLHQELSSIEQRAPVDFPSLPEESDSLKQQVDTLTAKKLALEEQTERVREELLLAHVALGETRYQMNRLKEELNVLKEEKYDWDQTGSAEDAAEDEHSPFVDLDAIFGTREDPGTAPVKGEDLVSMWMQEKVEELMERNQHLEDEKDQGQAEREALQREIHSLQETLREQVAALVVSQAQLRAVQEYVGSWQQTKEVSPEPQKESASKPSGLAAGTSQQEGHMAEMNKKPQVEAAEKKTLEKDLAKSPEEAEKERRQEGEDRGRAEVRETSGTLQEELSQTKHQLMEAEKNLEYYSENEGELIELESKKSSWDFGQLLAEKDSHLIGKNSSSQTDTILQVSSGNQTPRVPVKNTGIQSDLQSTYSSEDVTEIIRQFNEKINRMQELHAAEVLDMEARHITEAENLKTEQLVTIQFLTEECSNLKAAIQCLQAKEVVPGIQADFYQSREMCSSDSGLDWSQGFCLQQSQEFDVLDSPREKCENALTSKVLKGLLREVHDEGMEVLALTEPHFSEGDAVFTQQASAFWLEERKIYLNTISSLMDLITKIPVQRETELNESSQSHENPPDWRSEFLQAFQQIFLEAQNTLLAIFETQLPAPGMRDVHGEVNQLKQRLQEQGIKYNAAMEYIQSADRRSLLSEIQALRNQLSTEKMIVKREEESDSQSQELLEHNMQQKQAQILEMQVELSALKEKAAELQDELSSERVRAADLQDEWTQARLELETTLKAQHKQLKELEAFRMEVKEKTDKVHLLNDTLANEQKKTRELQWALEKEKAKLERSEEREREELEDLKYSLEGQKQRNIQLNQLLEQQKQLLSDLQQKIVSQGALYDAQISEERSQKSELQGLLESEKIRVLEMQETLERERELHALLQAHGDDDHEQDKASTSGEEVLRDLQKQLYEKHNRIVELVGAIEKYKLDSLQMRQQVEKDRQIHRKTLLTEQQANTEGLKKIHELQSKMEGLLWQLEEKRQEIYKLELERKRSQEIIQELQKQEQEKGEKFEIGGVSYQNLNEPTTWDSSSDRTRNWVLQQKIEGTEKKESSYAPLIEMNGSGTTEDIHELETIRQKLQLISSKLQQLACKASSRLQFEAADDEDFIWVQKNIDHILLQLQKFTGYSQQGEPTLVAPGISCSSLTERLLRQNAELTGHISQLTEEKNDLRNMVMKLEEEMRWLRQSGPCGDQSSRHSFNHSTNIEAVIASEKEIWNREKLALQKSLRQAEAEVCRLKAELRNEALLQDLNPSSENATLKRIYGKYLRAESFRKALIYQKNYLLLLLGGFQDCEDATLALIARMGGQPSCTDLAAITNQSKGFTRFRSAVRVSIAISRMKFLVRRWHRITGSSCSININGDGFGQNPGTFWVTLGTEKSDPFCSSPGGLELCGEQRHSSYRSRSDLDCPRSPLHFQHRYPADLNPGSLACSQLQNYDPDRALTDYISRLEALQRRLGNVQSGSITSYIQFHAGMRR